MTIRERVLYGRIFPPFFPMLICDPYLVLDVFKTVSVVLYVCLRRRVDITHNAYNS